jgi:predicted DNA-binding transcriptional regulator AlpA
MNLLIPKEVSPLVRRPEATLAYWRSVGKGPKYAKLNGRVVYRKADVEAWIQEQYDAEESA